MTLAELTMPDLRRMTDLLLFDTGHQAYVHKLLTGRADDFGGPRQAGGVSGYPSRTESAHDVIENSHASTALSYADGLAKAHALHGEEDRRVVALVGDGALTGGMAWEALNNLGAAPDRPVIVVLNDNGRSYAPTVGGLAVHLSRLRSGATGPNLFTALGFAYLGPVDGHDVVALEHRFRHAAALGRPVVVHAVTEKGKGYPPAEEDEADRMHAVTSAAGLAMGGLHPVVAVYSTFLNRAFDQVLMDVALHRLGVTFVLDRAGVTGPDGASHHGMWDASVLPVVPGLRLAAPRDPGTLRELLHDAVAVSDAPTGLRYPKATVGQDIPAVRRTDGFDVLREAPDAPVLLVAVGPLAAACLTAADELARHDVEAMVVDPLWTAPLSAALLRLAVGFRLVLTVEDTTATGAMGSRLAQALEHTSVATYALPAAFLPHASRAEILRAHGLDASGIAPTVLKRLKVEGT